MKGKNKILMEGGGRSQEIEKKVVSSKRAGSIGLGILFFSKRRRVIITRRWALSVQRTPVRSLLQGAKMKKPCRVKANFLALPWVGGVLPLSFVGICLYIEGETLYSLEGGSALPFDMGSVNFG